MRGDFYITSPVAKLRISQKGSIGVYTSFAGGRPVLAKRVPRFVPRSGRQHENPWSNHRSRLKTGSDSVRTERRDSLSYTGWPKHNELPPQRRLRTDVSTPNAKRRGYPSPIHLRMIGFPLRGLMLTLEETLLAGGLGFAVLATGTNGAGVLPTTSFSVNLPM